MLDGVPRGHAIRASTEGFYRERVDVDAPSVGVQLVCSIPCSRATRRPSCRFWMK